MRLLPVVMVVVLLLAAVAVFCLAPNGNGRGEASGNLAESVDSTRESSAQSNDTALSDEPFSQATVSREDLDLLPAVKDRRYDATIRDIVDREDPVVDGWDTERFSELADMQLKLVGKMLSDPTLIDANHIAKVAVPAFRGQLRPSDVTAEYSGSGLEIRRSTGDEMEGSKELEVALRDLAKVFPVDGERRFKFKIIRVQPEDSKTRTRSYFQMSSLGAAPVQVRSTWDCTWQSDKGATPKLTHISVHDYEEVHSTRAVEFVDATRTLFRGNSSLDEQFVYGRDHWYGNLESSIGVEGRGNGIAIGDANNDGLDDIYICQPAALPNRLYLRQRDGSLRDVSKAAGVDWLDSSRGALFVDIDNDGDQDLVLTQSAQVLVHENDGTGRFELRTAFTTISRLFSVNAVDFDNDQDLDLYVCGYSGTQQIRPEDIFASPVPYHDANNGAPNLLLRNDGKWQFSDVTSAVGLAQNNVRFSLASTWDDFDNDGDLDLYVANDFGRNHLYRNDNGRFTDIAGLAGVEDIGPGMSAAWGDYNNDGRPDLYVSNMFSSAGSRITHTAQFKPGVDQEDLSGFRRHARGNSLFENLGDGTFADQGESSGTMMGRWAWGSQFVDINNDGWRDVYVTNGFVTADNNNDL